MRNRTASSGSRETAGIALMVVGAVEFPSARACAFGFKSILSTASARTLVRLSVAHNSAPENGARNIDRPAADHPAWFT
jgi:hypothetical protein